MDNLPSKQPLEDALGGLFSQPDPVFLETLEKELALRAVSVPPLPTWSSHFPKRSWLDARWSTGFRRGGMVAVGALLLLGLVVMAAGPARVLAAVRGLLGFLPGVGFVSQVESVRMLAAPVQITREDVTLTVESAVADTQSFRLRLRVDGLEAYLAQLRKNGPNWQTPSKPVALRLPDGETVALKGETVNFEHALLIEYTFQPLPPATETVTLELGKIPAIQAGVAPEDWRIPIPLRPAQPDDAIAPATVGGWTGQTQAGVALVLDSVAHTGDQTALQVHLKNDRTGVSLANGWADHLLLTDATGKVFELQGMPRDSLDPSNSFWLQSQRLTAGETYTLSLSGPIEGTTPVAEGETQAQFTLDLGSHPEPGQEWDLDQTIQAGGYRLHLSHAWLLSGEQGGAQVRFHFDAHPGLIGMLVRLVEDNSTVSGLKWGGGMTTGKPWPLEPGVQFTEMPRGALRFQVDTLSFPIDGPWQVTWQMPAESSPAP